MGTQLSLQIFEYENRQNVRTIEIDGEIWFYAVDVCKILEISNSSQAISRLDDDEKQTLINDEGLKNLAPQSYVVISESGLYHLIFTSRKEEAQRFRKWVTNEVLPTIRKKGGYLLPGQRVVPVFIRRFNDNWDRVTSGYFSVLNELTIRIYGRLEQMGYIMPDKGSNGQEMRPDVSVGKLFPKWLEEKYPEKSKNYEMYRHKLPDGKEVEARQYRNDVLPQFIEFIDTCWIPERAYDYFNDRDKKALSYIPKMLPNSEANI